jgi:putrescine transport system permease protein
MKRTLFKGVFAKWWLLLGFVFLYLPIFSLIIYSFNESSLPGVWTGFTFDWYRQLLDDDELINGLRLSLKIAFLTANSAVILGTLAAFALTKYKRFYGRTFFSAMVNAPLVMPEVIVGLSLLLLLVSMQNLTGYPERGMLTIWLGHLLLCMAYATVVIQARLKELNPKLEEAAMDLGARPFQVFYLVTLPLIAQSLISAWLLTFTLSLDDVVLSSFLSGPGSTTLPLVIFSRARLGLSPSVNAIATVTVIVVALGVILASYFIARTERNRYRTSKKISLAERG